MQVYCIKDKMKIGEYSHFNVYKRKRGFSQNVTSTFQNGTQQVTNMNLQNEKIATIDKRFASTTA